MSSPYPILDSRPIDKWRVTELKEELKRRKLTTKGLKEDLLKRLDEAIRTELVAEDADNGLDGPQSELHSDQDREGSGVAIDVMDVSQAEVSFGEGKTEQFAARTAENMDYGCITAEKLDENELEEVDGSRGLADEDKVAVAEVVDGAISAPTKDPVVEEPAILAGKIEAPVISLKGQKLQHIENHDESGNLESQLEKDDLSNTQLGNDNSKSTHADNDSIITSAPSMQVSEVSPALELQVKSDSISNDSIPNKKIELKDNIIADDDKRELDVKPEVMQSSSSPIVADVDKSHPMDFSEPHENKSPVEGTGWKKTDNGQKKNDSGGMGSSEKLNLDQNSVEDSMEEDVLVSKQIDPESNSDEMGDKFEKVKATRVDEEGLNDVVGNGVPADTEVAVVENEKCPDAESAKRKLHGQSAVGNNDVAKRQRRWNSEALKLPVNESISTVNSTTPKDTFHSTSKRSFSKSESTAIEEAQKERIVPPSLKPSTNSLRIDRFLRPFTLKAAQELLGKTGTVTGFWMDHIKTHCYVSYSSVEEAIETRNAVYNLQWPANGGRLLIAEFVDPQDVKARVNPPPQPPATPVSRGPRIPPAQSTRQPQPSTQQQVQRQQLPPPPPFLPPPPPLSNPPLAREEPPQAREQSLPPPPPILEKVVYPPIITLDDLFRKTKATPRIYYLPLSDEQVARKLKSKGKNIEQ